MKNIAIFVVAFILGIATGEACRLFVHNEPRPPAPNSKIPDANASPINHHEAVIRAQRETIEELRQSLAAALSNSHASATSQITFGDQPPPSDETPPVGESDGERRKRIDAAIAKLDFLGSIEVDGMGRQERRCHERLQKRIVEREELTDLIASGDASDDELADLMRRRDEVDKAIGELNIKVRQNLISIVARNLGVHKDDAKEVVKTIADIISATE